MGRSALGCECQLNGYCFLSSLVPFLAKPSRAMPSQAKPSQSKPSQAKPSQAKPSQNVGTVSTYLVRFLALRALARQQTDNEFFQPSRCFRVDLVHQGLVVLSLPMGLGRGDLFVRQGHQDLAGSGSRNGKNGSNTYCVCCPTTCSSMSFNLGHS